MTTPTTVHALCLDLARETTSRVERYILLRLAMQAERVSVASAFNAALGNFLAGVVVGVATAAGHVVSIPTKPAPASILN